MKTWTLLLFVIPKTLVFGEDAVRPPKPPPGMFQDEISEKPVKIQEVKDAKPLGLHDPKDPVYGKRGNFYSSNDPKSPMREKPIYYSNGVKIPFGTPLYIIEKEEAKLKKH